MTSITLITSGGDLTIERLWIARWEALSNVVDATNPSTIEWTLNTREEMLPWIELNRRMDTGEVIHQHLLSITHVESIVDVMLPRDDEWMSYVHIDDHLPLAKKRDLYTRLGRWIRTCSRPFSYYDPSPQLGVHHNMNLYRDPLRRPFKHEDIDVKESLLASPYSPLTGIIHTAYLFSLSSQYEISDEERDYLTEIPWDTVRWKDMIELGLHVEIDACNVVFLAGRINSTEGYHPQSRVLSGWVDGRYVVRVPKPAKYVALLVEWFSQQLPTSILSSDMPSLIVPRLISSSMVNYHLPSTYRLTSVLNVITPILVGIAHASGVYTRTEINSNVRRYPQMCRMIADTLGSDLLMTIADSVADSLSRESMEDDDNARRWIRVATRVARSSETPHFTQWPLLNLIPSDLD